MTAAASDADLAIETRGSVAIVTLSRERALNALTVDMRRKLSEAFPKFARTADTYAVVIRSSSPRAFSAGSDVREVVRLAQEDVELARKAFRDEYTLNWQAECFSKPTISLIDGMVMGGGVGITLYGTHRVAGPGYRFAMPETVIGLFPDVGVCHPLSRMPDEIGVYLGLTGRSIGRADAYALGLATHVLDADKFGSIIEALADTEPVDPLLDGLHKDPGPGELDEHRETIAKCFSAETVGEIVSRLRDVTGKEEAWAKSVLEDLASRSPLSMAVTLRHIRRSKGLDLRQVLQVDYRLACRFLDDKDFYEGVRAQLIDKDGHPRWDPSAIDDVTSAMVDAYFAPLATGDWALPTRAEMQAARA